MTKTISMTVLALFIAASGVALARYAEADEGIHCVAAPIVDGLGACVATVWVSAPTRRMPRDRFREVGGLTMDAAREISRRLVEGA